MVLLPFFGTSVANRRFRITLLSLCDVCACVLGLCVAGAFFLLAVLTSFFFLLLLCSTVLLYLHFYRSCYIQYNVLNKFSLFFLDLIQPQPPYQMRTFFLYLSLDLKPLFFVPSLVSEPKHRTKKHHFVCITSTSRPLIVVSFFSLSNL